MALYFPELFRIYFFRLLFLSVSFSIDAVEKREREREKTTLVVSTTPSRRFQVGARTSSRRPVIIFFQLIFFGCSYSGASNIYLTFTSFFLSTLLGFCFFLFGGPFRFGVSFSFTRWYSFFSLSSFLRMGPSLVRLAPSYNKDDLMAVHWIEIYES